MNLEHLLEPGRVLCNVEARSKKHAIEILSQLLTSADHDLSSSEIFDRLIARERLGSTALGLGVAMPHGRVPGIETSVGAFIKLSEPIDFDAPDGDPVSLLCGILVPEECSEEHLQDLAVLAEAFGDDAVRDELMSMSSSRALYELLVETDAPDHQVE